MTKKKSSQSEDQVLPAPLAGSPIMTVLPFFPMPWSPAPMRMRRLRPSATYKYIRTTPRFPLFIYPYVPGARSHNAHIMWYRGPYIYYYLGSTAVGSACERNSQNKQHSFDTFHGSFFWLWYLEQKNHAEV